MQFKLTIIKIYFAFTTLAKLKKSLDLYYVFIIFVLWSHFYSMKNLCFNLKSNKKIINLKK